MTEFKKGYRDDVGIDICLDYDVEFAPFETKVISIGETIPVYLGECVMLCARTSAAARGIIVNQCPIDPNYTGPIHIIAHNCSKDFVSFPAGTAFAQLYAFHFEKIHIPVKIKKDGKRGENNFGSSDGGNLCC